MIIFLSDIVRADERGQPPHVPLKDALVNRVERGAAASIGDQGRVAAQAGRAGQVAVTALCCGGAGTPGPGAAGALSCSRWWWWLKILWQALPPLPPPPGPLLPPVKAPLSAAVASSSQGSSTSPSSLLGLWSLRRERIFSPVIAAAARGTGSGRLTAGRAGAAAAPGD